MLKELRGAVVHQADRPIGRRALGGGILGGNMYDVVLRVEINGQRTPWRTNLDDLTFDVQDIIGRAVIKADLRALPRKEIRYVP